MSNIKEIKIIKGHLEPIPCLCVDENCLYSGSWDKTIRVWSKQIFNCIKALSDRVGEGFHYEIRESSLRLIDLFEEYNMNDWRQEVIIQVFYCVPEMALTIMNNRRSDMEED